ncbi:hypothetical protein HF1_13610 [Mycoplasma haemofelis str. Langford 1]|uniref:Uncharacterized protein n=1 Tax=Mycoplasma haemofelis (strain Langford 1) TaxID=941640 RepID=E8ZJP8_MYCHL|nr:hypothetical protein [Mycoplasma haemofelis]CBY93369.1 hypothetical protein HF1_13610 [Mycoplasma haemofelis str. Langford 1]
MDPSKIAIPTLAAGASAASVGGYFYATSKQATVLDKVKESLKDHHRVLSSKDDSAWEKFKEVYKASKEKQISDVSEEKVNEWCESTLKETFTQDKYDKVMTWCVVYDRSIKDHVGTSLLPSSGEGVDGKWQKAWEKFEKDNSNAGVLKLSDDALVGSSKPSGKEDGGKALNKWCNDRYSMKMYELGAEDLSKKVEKWCSETQGT